MTFNKTTLEENLNMIRDSVTYLVSKGKKVFFDAEHFFDGYKNNKEYALSAIKTAYEAGETFSFAGLGAKAIYGDEAEYTIPSNEITWAPSPAPTVNADATIDVTATWQSLTSAKKEVAVTVNTHAVTIAATTNGTIAVQKQVGENWQNITSGDEFPKGTTLKVVASPAQGYQLATLTAGGVDIKEAMQFSVGESAIEVAATFSQTTALDNTKSDVKAVKVLRDGQIFILRGDKVYTVQGQLVK